MKHTDWWLWLDAFLTLNNAADNFFDNVRLSFRLDPSNIEDTIDNSFMWSSTNQGKGYWIKLDNMWRKFVSDVKCCTISGIDLTQKEIDEIMENYKKYGKAKTDKELRTIPKSSISAISSGGVSKYDGIVLIPKKACCDSPNIITNSAAGEVFRVCRTCKCEVDNNGFKV